MKSKVLIFLLAISSCLVSFSQKAGITGLETISFLKVDDNATGKGNFLGKNSIQGKFLSIEKTTLAEFVKKPKDKFLLTIPDSYGKLTTIELLRRNIFSEDFQYRTSSGTVKAHDNALGLHYIGKVKGGSSAVITIFEDHVLGNFETSGNTHSISLTAESKRQIVSIAIDGSGSVNCAVENYAGEVINKVSDQVKQTAVTDAQDRPIHIAIEVDNQFYMYQDILPTISHALNEMIFIYDNEEITVMISDFFVWDPADISPFARVIRSDDDTHWIYPPMIPRKNLPDDWRSSYKEYINGVGIRGDFAILLVEKSSFGSGVAARVGTSFTCSRSPAERVAVSEFYVTNVSFPNYNSFSQNIAHEIGHLLGSNHTYEAYWSGGGYVLDNCGIDADKYKEVLPGTALPFGDQHTVMSYCSESTEAASGERRGFGTQPGNLIRRKIRENPGITWAEKNELSVGCRDRIAIHRTIYSDAYEMHDAVYKANEIHAYNIIEPNASAEFKVPESGSIVLEPGFDAQGTFITKYEACVIPTVSRSCPTIPIPITARIAGRVFPEFLYDLNLDNDTDPPSVTGITPKTAIRDRMPLTSPYPDGLSVTEIPDNVLDWIWVELRDANDPTIILQGSSAFLTNDIGTDNIKSTNLTPLIFDFGEYTQGDAFPDVADFYVAIHHRNHLGIMSAQAYSFSINNTSISADVNIFNVPFGGNSAVKEYLFSSSSVYFLWGGDANDDGKIIYTGVGSDTDAILDLVMNDPGNDLNVPTFGVDGYYNTDVNCDGVTYFAGASYPDAVHILENVLNHPENTLNEATFIIEEQIPNN